MSTPRRRWSAAAVTLLFAAAAICLTAQCDGPEARIQRIAVEEAARRNDMAEARWTISGCKFDGKNWQVECKAAPLGGVVHMTIAPDGKVLEFDY
jgi:hypothetical protein